MVDHDNDTLDPEIADRFDSFARVAGRDLRRPAPEDALARIHRRKESRQRIHVLGASAVILTVVAVGAFSISGRNDEPNKIVPATGATSIDTTGSTIGSPESTAPTQTVETVDSRATEATEVAVTTVEPTTTTSTAQDELGIAAAEWLNDQLAAGGTRIDVEASESTPLRLLVPYNAAGRLLQPVAAAVQISPTRVVPMPPEMIEPGLRSYKIAALGTQLAVFQQPDTGVTITLFDPVTLEWADGPSLDAMSNASSPRIDLIDGSVLLTKVDFDDAGNIVSQVGVVLGPDLTVRSVATPPAPAVMKFDAVSGSKALLLGWDPFEDFVTLTHPWSYDIATNSWVQIPNPDWIDCGPTDDQCRWSTPHGNGDISLTAATAQGLVILVPDGTIGLLDTTTNTWRRLDDSPFVLSTPVTATVGNTSLAVLPVIDPSNIGILDLTTGHWTSIPIDPQGPLAVPSLRTTYSTVLAGFTIIEPATEIPAVAIDRLTGAARAPTPEDIDLWAANAPVGIIDTTILLDSVPPS